MSKSIYDQLQKKVNQICILKKIQFFLELLGTSVFLDEGVKHRALATILPPGEEVLPENGANSE